MNIKRLFLFILIGLFGFGFHTLADSSLTREQFFTSYVDAVAKNMDSSESYKDIVLKYKGITKDTAIYQTMQKAVSYKLFPNGRITLPLSKNPAEDQACAIIKIKFTISASCEKGKGVTSSWMDSILYQVETLQIKQNSMMELKLTDDGYLDDSSLEKISDILDSASTNSKNLSEIYDTIQKMIDSAQDPYTTFFPPTDAQQFNEEMQGEFEGIGAYVEMAEPGILIITSPIVGSPAQEAGLLAGDRILKIDNHRVNENIDTTTAVDWIKGPSGTQVKLLILRNKKILTFTITRDAIVVENISAKTYNTSTCYMAIGMFGYGVYDEFVTALTNVFGKNKCKEYIFDVRNNPGGSLEEVANILSYFVPTGKVTVLVDSRLGEDSLVASDIDGKKLTYKKVAILMNQGSASASEIFAGTIKDYLPYATLIGEKTYGKGSVQELLQYSDGSMLKYTVAKWYTGKSKTTIDHVGLQPDVKISDDPKTIEDEQLQAALTTNN